MSTLLQTTFENLKKARVAMAKNPDEYDFRARPGIEMAIRQAKDSIEDLTRKYSQAFLANAVGIFLMGDEVKIKEFTDLCASTNDGVRVDARALYDRIADRIQTTLGGKRTFGPGQATIAISEIMDIALELHVQSLKRPDFGAVAEVKTRPELVAVIRKGVRNALADDLNRMYVEKAAVDGGLAAEYTGVVAPVYVVNALPDEVAGLSKNFGRGSVALTIPADSEVTKEFVKEKLKEVNQKIKKSKKTSN